MRNSRSNNRGVIVKKKTPLEGAWDKGYHAGLHGLAAASCPYKGDPDPKAIANKFRSKWMEGWTEGRKTLED